MKKYEEYEKALEHFKAINEAEPDGPIAPYREAAIKALIKQIPTEPKDRFCCPNCGSAFWYKPIHCENCGQALKSISQIAAERFRKKKQEG